MVTQGPTKCRTRKPRKKSRITRRSVMNSSKRERGPSRKISSARSAGAVKVEPKNSRRDQVLARGKWIVGLQRHAALKNRANRHAVTDLCRHAKTSGRRFVAAFFRADAETGTGDRIRADYFIAAFQSEPLIVNRDVDLRAWTLHVSAAAIQSACR